MATKKTKRPAQPAQPERPRHDAEPIKQWTRGWETAFRHAFEHLFEPNVERLDEILAGRLDSETYYRIVAILHDMALAHASTLTGVRKPPVGTAPKK